jgi:NitT/TauT family transport system ATP-binding protein
MATAVASGCTIEIRQVNKTYRLGSGGEVLALAGVSFDVKAGEFVSIVGPSGCGKSTLLSIVGGLSAATQGEVCVNGSIVREPRRDVGFVFQDPVLLPWRSVLSNAMIGIEVLGLDQRRYRDRAHELLDLVGLRGFETALPAELSGGMQQRNAIVRALLHQPSLLLMDEPFGALDAMTREHMGYELLKIWSHTSASVLFVTHSVAEALFLSDRVVVMSARPGRILDVIEVGLPRPRDLDMMNSPEVADQAKRIRHMLGSQGGVE